MYYYNAIEQFKMGGHIPKTIKTNVLKNWVEGYSIEQIAREEGIATGSVSNIIQERRQNDPEFDLMRQLALKLKNDGDTIESFASTVRLKERIRKILLLELPSSSSSSLDTTTMTTTKNGKEEVESTIALEHEKIESFIEFLEVFCFKRNKSIKEFFDIVYRISFTAYNKFGIPFENLPDYVQRLESEADTLIEQIEEKKLEKQEALEDYDVTLESLEEYIENRPLFETNERLREQLDKVRQQRDNYATELMSERIGKVFDEYNNCWVTDD